MGFSSASPFLTRKWEAVTQGGIWGIEHPTRRRHQGAGIVPSKGGRTSKTAGTFQIQSRKTRIT